MARYNASFRSIETAVGPCFEIRATSSDKPRLLELHIQTVSSLASFTLGLGTPAVIGVNPTTSYRVIAEDDTDPLGTTIVATGWTTAPTVPSAFFRRFVFRTAIAATVYVGFPRGLQIEQSGSRVLWIIGNGVLVDASVVVDE